ncbi:hypothetical protein [Legionella erythra]|uniref:Transmembrane protein n=1 Tax=Legionella erythra TaxID=448 RepID=A0A0W0TT26_LEGER|nr:hypothetical protein [Legionella erythra]KTC98608.1 hypothetical protein Lery_0772 [Legionella erythra]
MLEWLKKHWKLVAAIGLALLIGAGLTALYFFAPPVAAVITGFLVANAPAIATAIAAMSPVAGAFVVGALGAAATLAFAAIWNLGVKITNALDGWINSKGKEKKEAFSPLVNDEETDSNLSSTPTQPERNPLSSLGGPKTDNPLLINLDAVPGKKEDKKEEVEPKKEVKLMTGQPPVSEDDGHNPTGLSFTSS